MRTSTFLLAGAVLASAAPWQGASAYTHQILYSFCAKANCVDGAYPQGALVMDGSGNLFGTTEGGGKIGTDGRGEGTVFELTPNAKHTRWRYGVIHSFCQKKGCSDGDEPAAPLIIDQNGNLYGTTPFGGDNDSGVVFKLSPSGSRWTYTVLHRFCRKTDCPDGQSPDQGLSYAGQTSGLPYDGTSTLYGTTNFGGRYNSSLGGTVFTLTPDQATGTWKEKVLYSFCSSASCTPQLPPPTSTVTIASDGTLYGTVDDDGFTGNVFALSLHGNRWREKTVYTFCALANCADGEAPDPGVLTPDTSGNLYGTTLIGGSANQGTVFEFDPMSRQLTTLYSFCSMANCADGTTPQTGVVRNASGDLFGVASEGGDTTFVGQGGGTAFMLHNGSFQLLYSFCSVSGCADGREPETGLVLDSGGALYGVTQGGGANESGTVYALVP
jgi:uncharacterized repeat protein (TIGR03803 family)